MSLTDSEIRELDQLLDERSVDRKFEKLINLDQHTSPNYKFLHESINSQVWGIDKDGKPEIESGYAGCILEGSSRSTKTWAGVDVIIWLCAIKHKDDGCTINIYRETYNEFKTTLYDDFKRRLDDYDLPNKFKHAEEVSSFKIGNSKIHFLGDGKHGGGCDYAFFNEAMTIKNSVFDQVEMRCRAFWWMDYNPSFTSHWVFDKVAKRSDVGFLRTTFKDNKYIAATELNKILSYEPWKPNSYTIEDNDIMYNGEVVTDKNKPPPHKKNVEQGTADAFMWKVYGLGLRGAMKGVIFPNVTYIDEFPDLAHTYGNDFGFTVDPNTTVKYGQEGRNIYLELLCYEPIEDPAVIAGVWEANGITKEDVITADSSDKYTGENKGTVEMVRDLRTIGYSVTKVKKTESVMFWLLSMKKCKIHIVKNHLVKHAKTEQENYKMKEVNGIAINQPEDKHNHFWDGARYAHMAYNRNSGIWG